MLSVSTIQAKYKRAKLSLKDTCLWLELNDIQKGAVQKRIEFGTDEQPVIYYCKSPIYSWVISNRRLIVLEERNVWYYFYQEIKKVELPNEQDIKTNKAGIDTITISLYDNNFKTLFVEDRSWHFIYQILKFLLPDNKAK